MTKTNDIISEVNIDKYRALYYAAAANDFNPIHFDEEAAKEVGLNGIILHGLCVLGFISNAITDWTGDPGKLKKIKCKFSNFVAIGDTIKIHGKVNDISENISKIDFNVTNQNDEKILKRVSAEIRI